MKSFEESRGRQLSETLRRFQYVLKKGATASQKPQTPPTPYWLTLSLNKREDVSLPIIFGEKKKQRIEEAFRGEWKFTAVEMVKRCGRWYAHFVLWKNVEPPDEPETVVAIDRG